VLTGIANHLWQTAPPSVVAWALTPGLEEERAQPLWTMAGGVPLALIFFSLLARTKRSFPLRHSLPTHKIHLDLSQFTLRSSSLNLSMLSETEMHCEGRNRTTT
jgi:hypothetical protein